MLPQRSKPIIQRFGNRATLLTLKPLAGQVDLPESGQEVKGLLSSALDLATTALWAMPVQRLETLPERAQELTHQRKALFAHDCLQRIDANQFVWYINHAGDLYPHR